MLEMLSAARNREFTCQCLKPKDVYYLCDKNPSSRADSAAKWCLKHPGAFVLCIALLPQCLRCSSFRHTGHAFSRWGEKWVKKASLLKPSDNLFYREENLSRKPLAGVSLCSVD